MVQKFTSPVRIYKHPFELVMKVSTERNASCANFMPFEKSIITASSRFDVTN